MLRIVPQASAQAAKGYYARADYYLGSEAVELPGVWGGRGAERLGLHGEVREADFHALCDNLRPDTGDRLTARTRSDRRVLFDWNFHVPKSVTLAYELGGDARVLDVFRDAVEATMREAEREAAVRVRARGADHDRTTGTLVWATFVHRTARPSKADGLPDPHLHAHVCVFNASFDGQDGKWKAAQMGGLKADAPYFEAAFHARLAAGLRRLGYGIERRGKGWELAGVSPALVKAFSRRTAEIDALAERLGVTDPAAKAKLGATSRRHKADAAPATLADYWRGRLTQTDTEALTRLRDGPLPAVRTVEEAVAWAAAHHFEREAAVADKAFAASVLRFGAGGVTPGQVGPALRPAGIEVAELDGRRLVYSKAVLAEERRLLAFARDGRGTRRPLAPGHAIRDERLSASQRAAVAHVLESADAVTLVRGAAGTGKTALTKEAVSAIEGQRVPVAVLAPTSLAARDVLRAEGFPAAETVAAFLASDRLQRQVDRGVIWVDEAGLLGVCDLARLAAVASQQQARLVLLGDSRQHGSVARGPALKLLETHAGLKPAVVADIRRQRGDYKRAVGHLAAGRTEAGFRALDALGWVKELPAGEREQAAATEYAAAISRGESVCLVCPTHRGGEGVTAAVRERLRADGRLGEERVLTRLVPVNLTAAERADPPSYTGGEVLQFVRHAPGRSAGSRIRVSGPADVPTELAARFAVYRPAPLPLAVGDRVRVTANGRTADGKHRVSNGATYTVAGFAADGGVRLDNGWTLAADFCHLTHGYVSTSFAAQGQTADRAILVAGPESYPAVSAAGFYVATSRGRKQLTVLCEDKDELLAAASRDRFRPAATDLARPTPRDPHGARLLARTVAFLERLASLARAHGFTTPDRGLRRGQDRERAAG